MATRTLNIQSCDEVKSGTDESGPWTLYAVHALDEEGETVGVELQSFSSLPIGLGTYDVTKPEPPYAYTFLKPARGGAATSPSTSPGADWRDPVERLTRRVTELERAVRAKDHRPTRGRSSDRISSVIAEALGVWNLLPRGRSRRQTP